MTFMKKWLDDILADENVEVTTQDLAYITYAAVQYGLTHERINKAETFGPEFRGLNYAMSNIYGQIDNIKDYNPGRTVKYDSDAIRDLRLEGKTAKEICAILGIEENKHKSISTNKGWKEAGEILKQKNTENTENTEKSTKNTEFVDTENTQKNTENIEKIQKIHSFVDF